MEPSDACEPSATPPAGDDAHSVPRHTTPAWESELLLSIGLVVGLMQMPSVLDGRFDAIVARAAEAWLTLVVYAYLYAKVAVYALIGTFIVHLLARGFWVALLGLRSVFPGGVRWDRLDRMGPIAQELARRENVPMPALIERADNFASATFAYGFLLLATALMIGLVTTVVVALATGLSQALLQGRDEFRLLLLFVALGVVPYVLATFVDRRFGSRLAPGGVAARTIRFLLTRWRFLTLSRTYREMMLVFSSNLGQRRTGWLLALSLYALFGVVVVDQAVRRNAFDWFDSGYLPRQGEWVVERAHYADQRGSDWRSSWRPFVQSDVVADPYLKVFVPLWIRRYPDAVREGCAEIPVAAALEFAQEGRRQRQLLDCLGRMLEPQLDGKAIDVRFEFGEDAASTMPGMVGYLPLAGLEPGRHELVLQRIAGSDAKPRPNEDPAQRIPFWR